jgi:L-malate glycosyltransferase
VASSIANEAGVPVTKIWTITNFVDDAAFGIASPDDREAIRHAWNVPDDVVLIGCVARLHPVKDHTSLLHAFARLRMRQPGVFLVLIGDGENRSSLHSLVRELQIDSAVHFAGELRHGGNLHRAFDISVLASRSEGFPNTIVEAMAAGIPVVATAVGGSIDAVVDGETGFLVPPAAPSALADALARLVENASLRGTMGAKGLRQATELYSAPRVLDALQGMYDQLVAGARG